MPAMNGINRLYLMEPIKMWMRRLLPKAIHLFWHSVAKLASAATNIYRRAILIYSLTAADTGMPQSVLIKPKREQMIIKQNSDS